MRQILTAFLAASALAFNLSAQAPRTQVIGYHGNVSQIHGAFPMPNGDVILTGTAPHSYWDADPNPDTDLEFRNMDFVFNDGRKYPFIQRLQADGRIVWTRQLPAVDEFYLSISALDNHFILGLANDAPFDADPGPGTSIVNSNTSSYFDGMLEFDASGELAQLTHVSESVGWPWFRINQDEGFFMLVHLLFGTQDIDPGPAVLNITDLDNSGDLVITRHRPDGSLLSHHHYPLQGNFNGAYFQPTLTEDGGFSFAIGSCDSLDINPEPNITHNISCEPGLLVRVHAAGDIISTMEYPVQSDDNEQNFKFNPDGTFLTWSGGTISHYDTYLNLLQTYALITTEIHDAAFAQGRLWVVGAYTGTTDLDPGPATVPVTYDPNAGMFVATLDSATAQVQWAGLQGRLYEYHQPCLYPMADGSVLEILQFHPLASTAGPADVDPGPGVHPVSSDEVGSDDVERSYLVRLGGSVTTPGSTEGNITLFPNPLPQGQSSLSIQLGDLSGSGTLDLFDPAGRRIQQLEYKDASFVEIDLPEVAGLYLVRASNGSEQTSTRVLRR